MNRTFGRPNEKRHGLRAASITMVLAAGLVTSAAAGPPCKEGWLRGDRSHALDGAVLDMASWDDGFGPALFVGGEFRSVSGVPAAGLGRWNGTDWTAVSDSLWAERLTVVDVWRDRLIVGGDGVMLDGIPVHTFAVWDGSAWNSLDRGFADDRVTRRLVHGDELYILGPNLQSSDGDPTPFRVGRLDETGWSGLRGLTQVIGGTVGAELHGSPSGVMVSGELITMAGTPGQHHFARWNGSAWQPPFPVPPVLAADVIAIDGTGYILERTTDTVWESDGGPWQPVAAGDIDAASAMLSEFENRLAVLGALVRKTGTGPYSSVLLLDGEEWVALGDTDGVNSVKRHLLRHTGDVLFASSYRGVGVARLTAGNTWQSFTRGADYSLRNLVHFQGSLVGVVDTVVARRVDDSWIALEQPGQDLLTGGASGCIVHEGELYAFGGFALIDGQPAPRPALHVARWDGANWQPLGTGLDQMPLVIAAASFADDLVLAGQADQVFPGSPNLVRAWNGSSFRTLGGTVTGVVQALEPFDGSLIAGGSLTSIGPVAVNRIARWDGAAWHPMSDGFDSSVHALVVYNGQLIAGGQFTASDSTPLARIARWDGAAWQPLGGFDDGTVETLAVIKGQLVAGGTFTTSDGVEVNRIARWDGAAWQPFDEGVRFSTGGTPTVRDIIEFDGDMLIAGNFSAAGLYPSAGMATWGCIEPSCPTDLTGASHPSDPRFGIPDGQLTEADFEYFLGLFIAGDPAADFTGSADPSDPAYGAPDGRLTAEDMFYYLDLFDQGCG